LYIIIYPLTTVWKCEIVRISVQSGGDFQNRVYLPKPLRWLNYNYQVGAKPNCDSLSKLKVKFNSLPFLENLLFGLAKARLLPKLFTKFTF
jgi:hypothetical protein